MSFVGELWQVYVLFCRLGLLCRRLDPPAHQPGDRQLVYGQARPCHLHRTFGLGLWRRYSVSHRELAYRGCWRSAFLVLAAICMVAALPITAYSFRTKPSEIGLKPLGENQASVRLDGRRQGRAHGAEVSVGWSRIKKSPAFWLLVVAFLFMGLVNGAILPNQVTNMTSVTVNGAKIVTGGHDPMWAGTVLSVYMVTVVIAKISLGAL